MSKGKRHKDVCRLQTTFALPQSRCEKLTLNNQVSRVYKSDVAKAYRSPLSKTSSEISTLDEEMASEQPYLTLPTGAKFPLMGMGLFLGSFHPNQEEAVKTVETALEIGYRSLDTAKCYNSEAATGKAIANKIKSGLIKRSDIFVTTKLWRTDSRREDVVPALKKSLERLGLDYVDLYLIHWPTSLQPGDADAIYPRDNQGKLITTDTDYLETWKGMEECVDKGLTKAIGISNFNSKQILRILEHCRIKPANNQVEIHPFFSNRKLVDFCHEKGISVAAYSPLAGLDPICRSKKRPDTDWPSIFTDETIGKIAKKHGKTPAQVTLRYLMHRGLAVLPRSSNPGRLRENLEAIHFDLTKEDISELEKCDENIRFCEDEPSEHINYPFGEEF